MKKLIVCCDGTWNTKQKIKDEIPATTNVFRLYNCLLPHDESGIEQKRYYHSGVGTEGGCLRRLISGVTGAGLDRNLAGAYKWLAANYGPGDRIFLFGFSRGAYTVRRLAALICHSGLPDLTDRPEDEAWRLINESVRNGGPDPNSNQPNAAKAGDHMPGVYFLGVWDTVGALGIPNEFAISLLLRMFGGRSFQDTRLSGKVEHARHALALDESRGSFTPTLWTDIQADADVKQVWFPGAHADVGGGYREKGLSDGALKWMIDEAWHLGLSFHDGMRNQVKPDALDVLHESCAGIFRHFEIQPRSIPLLDIRTPAANVHPSVYERQANSPIAQNPYHPTVALKPGESHDAIDVFALQRWNDTGVYLEANACYQLTATGQWLDRNIKCGPEGVKGQFFRLGRLAHLLGSIGGGIEHWGTPLVFTRDFDLVGTKREESMPWFCLVGAIANAENPQINGTPARHETFAIRKHLTLTPKKSGYLYCYANDAWHSYDNNKGSVCLRIHRIT